MLRLLSYSVTTIYKSKPNEYATKEQGTMAFEERHNLGKP